MMISMGEFVQSCTALFDGDKSNVGISFVLETVNRKSTKKRSWEQRDVMKNGKRGRY
jgi:hypothetical protein